MQERKPDECNECGKTYGEKLYEFHQNGEACSQNEESIQRISILEKPFEYNGCTEALDNEVKVATHKSTYNGGEVLRSGMILDLTSSRCQILIYTRDRRWTWSPLNAVRKTLLQKVKIHYTSEAHTGEKPYACNVCGEILQPKRNPSPCIGDHI